jgi:hypothetical protein
MRRAAFGFGGDAVALDLGAVRVEGDALDLGASKVNTNPEHVVFKRNIEK